MGLRAVRTREYRRALAIGLSASAAIHLGVLGMTFDVLPPEEEAPPTARDMARPAEMSRAVEVIRLAVRSSSATRPPAHADRGAVRISEPAPSEAPPEEKPAARQAWDQPLRAGLAPSVLNRIALIEETGGAPMVFADLFPVSPEPRPGEADGSGTEEDQGGGWLSGLAGIFGDIGISLDGGICPVPRGRAGWR